MSEILKGSFLTDKKGRKMEIVDAEARAKAEQNAAAIGELSEGKPYQQYVTDGDGKAKWEDRYGYAKRNVTTVIPEMTATGFEADVDRSEVYEAQVAFETDSGFTYETVYTVMWDGAEYTAKANYGNSDTVEVGNFYFYSAGIADNSLPFWLGWWDNTVYVRCLDTNPHTFSVSIVDEEIVPIPAEYLPEGVGSGGGSIVITYDGENYTCNVPFSEMKNAVAAGRPTVYVDASDAPEKYYSYNGIYVRLKINDEYMDEAYVSFVIYDVTSSEIKLTLKYTADGISESSGPM